MVLTAASIRKALAARVASIGAKEATGPLGVELEPATLIDRCFEVVLTDDADAGERVRAGARMWLTVQFTVRLVHKVKPKAAGEAQDAALNDADAVRRVLLTNAADALQSCQNTITYGGCSREFRGGGAYILTTQRWALRYDASLVT